jgi:hypothetical protein
VHELAAGGQRQLLANICPVNFDRLNTDMKVDGDFSGPAALAQQLKDLELAVREVFNRRLWVASMPGEGLEDFG